ncbi:hypothetical protein AA12717_0030 [Gluconacetobacter sacchari DSM 12717]|uniref:Iron-containing redox enzyme family protein n=3 Tax=Gluconacetobacter sacchari TaxID=92759 RepID=A0A7W4IGF5_9PROT|nr:iron-containing redox enzyme family protein [Gluconacetobacter sacchari]MBB2162440.1 iron-containing redox enzyme family protein [Gluconacetobacter sacchari]GBQ18762.1 hypothetical protein AA12717_0030 [Gluconacetobacter sacchari DSM 12717]
MNSSETNDFLAISRGEAAVLMGGAWQENSWFRHLSKLVKKGFYEGDNESQLQLHRILNSIYRVLTVVPDPGAETLEGTPYIESIRSTIEKGFIDWLNDTCVLNGIVVPGETSFANWLWQFVETHPAATHQAYFEFLANRATIEDLRFYLVQESAIDASTDDFLASLQIGAPGEAKMEIARNYWDEMGEGDPNFLHSTLFSDALGAFSISNMEAENALTLEALICGNLQQMVGLRRNLFHIGVGYFGATEQLVPKRFEALKRGWERVGLNPSAAKYHMLHIEVDGGHSEGWYQNVVAPLSKRSEQVRREITTGALYRLVTSHIYLDKLLRDFPSQN